MAIGLYFAPAAMNARAYDACIKQLDAAGAAHPPGRLYHACFGTKDKLQVFDVWDSQAAFEKFGQTLMPVLQQLGVDPGAPSVMEVHNIVIPPGKATSTRPRARKRTRSAAPRRASAARKPKRRGRK